MSDRFHPVSMRQLATWVFSELAAEDAILGLPRRLFFVPRRDDPFTLRLYGHHLQTPFGVAAGPHTQMAQNIVLAWLCGARVIELKTVQTLDSLDITKPCIHMQDEGYNVEWSQELAIDQSIDEYVRAWVLVHALHAVLGFPGEGPGVLFNLSVGYDLQGVKSNKVRRFVDSMLDARELIDRQLGELRRCAPQLGDLEVPSRVANSVTLSTMHGCPPGEIGRISTFLMDEWGLHTSVKLNPTLLGPEELRHILHDRLGYRHVDVPDQAFAHDIGFADAVDLLHELGGHAERSDLVFGAKLTNTLEVVNGGAVFDAAESSMYLSGRPLHALTVNVARRLAQAVGGDLLMSFAGGADAFNAPHLLAAGFRTVTTCSDILRPGGYSRLGQYIDTTRAAMAGAGAADLDHFIRASAGDGTSSVAESAGFNLERYAAEVLGDEMLHRDRFARSSTKTSRGLGLFDCVKAPCTDACFVDQSVPEYMRLVRAGRLPAALAVTRRDNPLPAVLGRACNHPCEPVCLRTHYDEPLAIREIKRYIMDSEHHPPGHESTAPRHARRVAVVGGGPCGLSAATFLAREGFAVTVFESRPYAGGMVAGTIPAYRAVQEVMDQDMRAVEALGVELRYGVTLGQGLALEDLRSEGFAYVILATGAQEGWSLGIDGEHGDGVIDGLVFLRTVKHGEAPTLGERVAVIGGGDVAMDCARTARRLAGGEVSVLYRRTREQMPAQDEEVADLLAEGISLVELVTPKNVLRDAGAMTAVVCTRMELGEADASGRRRPVPVAGSDFELPLDTLIVAIGQRPRLGFLADEGVKLTTSGHVAVDPETLESSVPGVFAGGDAITGASQTIVRACGDGRRIAEVIHRREGGEERQPTSPAAPDRVELLRRRSRRSWRVGVPHTPASARTGFNEVVLTLTAQNAEAEAGRCLDCDLMCSTCETVCPNHAILTYRCAPVRSNLPRLTLEDGALRVTTHEPFAVAQGPQVAVLTDLCNECGNCATFCPSAGRPYRDKPRLYLDRADFEAERDNAFMVFSEGELWSMEARFDGAAHHLELGDYLRYHTAQAELLLRRQTLEVIDAQPDTELREGTEIDLRPCATMLVLLRSLRDSMPGLPTRSRLQ